MALPYDVVPKPEDEFVIEGVDYTVVDVQLNYFPENVGTLVRLSRKA